MKSKISIVIVHYNVKKELFVCIDSIYSLKPKIPFEIIVVDNDEVKTIESELKDKFPKVRYIKSKKNLGYGGGNNLGVKYANGEYLFFLNPDTKIQSLNFEKLLTYFKDKKAGVIAPLLLNEKKEPMKQGSIPLTPFVALVKMSFIDKIFPNNPISKKFWVENWQGSRLKEVGQVPGTAFVISKKLFEKIGKFDERFFLYFEEYDICKRVKDLGYKIYIDPNSRIIHKWGKSTERLENKDKIFSASRFIYFRKHYGLFPALMVEAFLCINKKNLVLLGILLLAIFLRFYKINEYIPFIGDQGWFYLSARDMLLTGKIPLVGITSSHVWLHQGPLWTYILGILFWFFKFNPLVPAYFTAFLGVVTVFLVYKTVEEIFSSGTAVIAAVLYSTSPLVILHSRMAFDTSPIPFLVVLLILSLYRWLKGKSVYFAFSLLLISMLYALELATTVLFFVVMLIVIYGYIKKTNWFNVILNKKILIYSILGVFIPLIPILIYDLNNGFKQTAVFSGWIFYRGLLFPLHMFQNQGFANNLKEITDFFSVFIEKLVFINGVIFSFFLILLSFFWFSYKINKNYKNNSSNPGMVLIFLFTLLPSLGIFINKTPSEAYLLPLFVPVIILISVFLNSLTVDKTSKVILYFLIFCITLINAYILTSNNYFIGSEKRYGPSFKERTDAAKYMINNSGNKSYMVVAKGEGTQFESFTANYEYLGWYYGKSLVKRNGEIIYIIRETPQGIIINRKN